MRWRSIFLYVAILVFVGSSVAIMMSLEDGSRILALGGAIGNVIAAILFALAIWLPRRRIDWDRIQAEQRLWESGPLGRKWLRVRRRMYRRWKL